MKGKKKGKRKRRGKGGPCFRSFDTITCRKPAETTKRV
jgi:hypothetical protein